MDLHYPNELQTEGVNEWLLNNTLIWTKCNLMDREWTPLISFELNQVFIGFYAIWK